MVNADPVWQYWMELFQNAVEGDDLKERLIFDLYLTKASHDENVVHKNEYYTEIIWWNPENPFTPEPPEGWEWDPTGGWIFEGGEQNGG